MTTPIERMRALRWAEQLLRELEIDPLVSLELQHRATEVSCRYPSHVRLLEVLSEPEARFPRELATVLFDAGRLLEAVDLPGRVSPATRDLLRGTMRHFPSRINGWHRPEDFNLFRVEELLDSQDAINGRGATDNT